MGPHAGFIVAAYAVTAVVIAGLIVAVVADGRAQRRALAALTARLAGRAGAAQTGEPHDEH